MNDYLPRLLLVVLICLGWQEWRVRQAESEVVRARLAAAVVVPPVQVDDSTTVVQGLVGVSLERDKQIQRLTRELDAAVRAQLDLRLRYEADLAAVETRAAVRVEEATSLPEAGLQRYDVPFTIELGDSLDGALVDGSIDLLQPGPDWLGTIGVRLTRLRLQAEVQIDLVEGPAGWRSIVRSSTPLLRPDVRLAVLPRAVPWHERLKFAGGLGLREGSPLVFGGLQLEPWGLGVTAGRGVGVFVFKTF